MRLRSLPALTDNYIWLLQDDAGAALIVDPGQAEPVLEALAGAPRPTAILLTHHHDDHIGGVAALLSRWPGLPVFAPHDTRIGMASERVVDGQQMVVGPWQFTCVAVPGHTVSHVAFHGHGLLFSGDTLFSLGCGRLFEGTPAQMLDSLDCLAALPGTTAVCCGHEYTLANGAFASVVEPDNQALRRRVQDATAMRAARLPTVPSTLADERSCNPFLRIDQPGVRAALAAHAGRDPGDRADAFAALRQWKDGFRA